MGIASWQAGGLFEKLVDYRGDLPSQSGGVEMPPFANRGVSRCLRMQNRGLQGNACFKNRRLLRFSFLAKFANSGKLRNANNATENPNRQKIFDSGKLKNANNAVENQVGRRFLTAGN